MTASERLIKIKPIIQYGGNLTDKFGYCGFLKRCWIGLELVGFTRIL